MMNCDDLSLGTKIFIFHTSSFQGAFDILDILWKMAPDLSSKDVISALKKNNLVEIESLCDSVNSEIRSHRSVLISELHQSLGKTIFRNLCAETYIPESQREKKFIALR